jgi:Kef-type K+ transport system membrane component KefB
MFLVGLEFNTGFLRGRLAGAGLISGTGIVVPFALGGLLALPLLGRGGLFAPEVSTLTAVLYLGASMSITAFPILARILAERGLAGTRLGTISLAAGAIGDAIAWCLLAVMLASFRASPEVALLTIGGGALYVLLMLGWARRRLAWFGRGLEREGRLTVDRYTAVLLVLLTCALVTDRIGIHAVFGAFIAGVSMPRGRFAALIVEQTEAFTTTLLLPIFFVYSGLNTQIGLLSGADLVWIAVAVILVASVGKGVACTVAARLAGESWRDAAVVGTLMNARGLMELIILNIGRELGVISPTLFTIMVLMAVATTLAASPLYNLLAGRRQRAPGGAAPVSS